MRLFTRFVFVSVVLGAVTATAQGWHFNRTTTTVTTHSWGHGHAQAAVPYTATYYQSPVYHTATYQMPVYHMMPAGCQGMTMQFAAPAGCHGSFAGFRTAMYYTPMTYTFAAGCQGSSAGTNTDPTLKSRLDSLESDVATLKSMPADLAALRKNVETSNAANADILKAIQADFQQLRKRLDKVEQK
jgi:hypothetical protein